MSVGWLTIEEYADKVGLSAEFVAKRVGLGEFGPVATHPETGHQLVVWPPHMQSLPITKLPKPGSYQFRVMRTIRATVSGGIEVSSDNSPDDIGAVREELLRAAHSVGKPEEAAERAGELLNRSALIIH